MKLYHLGKPLHPVQTCLSLIMDVVIFCSISMQENSDLDNLSTLESGLSKDTSSFPGQTALSIESEATTIDTLSDHDRVAPPVALYSVISPVSCAIVAAETVYLSQVDDNLE